MAINRKADVKMDARRRARFDELWDKPNKSSAEWEEMRMLSMEYFADVKPVKESAITESVEIHEVYTLDGFIHDVAESARNGGTKVTNRQEKQIKAYRAMGLTEAEAQIAAGVHDEKLRQLAYDSRAERQYLQNLKETKR